MMCDNSTLKKMPLPCIKRFQLYVTHITSEGPFIKVSGYHLKDNVILIEKLLAKCTRKLISQNPITLDDVYVGMLCAALYENKLWRARIIDVSNVYDEEVDILFIDLGKIHTIGLSYLRHFDKDEDPRLLQIEPLANVYYLSRFIHPTGEWDSYELFKLNILLVKQVFTAVIDAETPFLPVVSLYSSMGDLLASLVAMDLGFGVPLPIQLYNIQLWARSHAQLEGNPFIFKYTSNTERNLLDISSQELGLPRSQLLELNSEHKVRVCHANASPEHFLVQLIDDEVDISEMVNDINKFNHQAIVQPPQIGSLCLARMSECDYLICRVIVLNISATKCELYALDYGRTQTVSYQNIFTMSKRFEHYGVFVRPFTLKGAAKFKGNGVNNLFQMLVRYEILNLKVVPTENPLFQCAKLYTQEGEDISNLLTKEMEERKFEKIDLTPELQHLAVISHVKSCINFYIHLCEMSDELTQIMKGVEMHCKNSPPPSRVVEDMACCAKSCDGKWYRAKVLSIEDNVVDVQFVDFGYNEKVEISNLRCITTELMQWHMQAMHCALNAHQWKHNYEICGQHFKDFVPNKQRFIATLLSCDSSDVPKVSLHLCNQQGQFACDINKTLINIYKFGREKTQYVQDEFDDTTMGATNNVHFHSEHSEDDVDYLSYTTDRIDSPHPNADTNSDRKLLDLVSLYTPYKEPDLKKASQYEFTVTWVVNPKDFYIQILSLVPEYLEIMEKVTELYKDVPSIDTVIHLDASVLVKYSPDQVYRATVESNWDGLEYGVRYVDFGNKMVVKKKYLFQMDRQLMELPKMAVRCSLRGIQPIGLGWKLCSELDACFNASSYKCVFNKMGRICKVTLYHDGVSVADKLIEKDLAIATYVDSSDESQYDYYYTGPIYY